MKRSAAATADARSPLYGNAPTFRENGVDLTIGAFHGVFAPKGTPKVIVARLNAEIVRWTLSRTRAGPHRAGRSTRVGVTRNPRARAGAFGPVVHARIGPAGDHVDGCGQGRTRGPEIRPPIAPCQIRCDVQSIRPFPKYIPPGRSTRRFTLTDDGAAEPVRCTSAATRRNRSPCDRSSRRREMSPSRS